MAINLDTIIPDVPSTDLGTDSATFAGLKLIDFDNGTLARIKQDHCVNCTKSTSDHKCWRGVGITTGDIETLKAEINAIATRNQTRLKAWQTFILILHRMANGMLGNYENHPV